METQVTWGILAGCTALAAILALLSLYILKKEPRYLQERSRKGEILLLTFEQVMALYRAVGYECLPLSAVTGEGLEVLAGRMRGAVCLLAGHSGVGKSTLLNRLIPGANARTAAVSAAHGTGMHTTTFSELYDLPGGGSVIDIPGIKGFGTFDMEPGEVAHYFRDIFHLSAGCRFHNCTHTHEPGCAVLEALEEHRLAPTRYASYLSMLEDKDETKYRQPF